jgi:fido (protein-threonine AMPylation protein)
MDHMEFAKQKKQLFIKKVNHELYLEYSKDQIIDPRKTELDCKYINGEITLDEAVHIVSQHITEIPQVIPNTNIVVNNNQFPNTQDFILLESIVYQRGLSKILSTNNFNETYLKSIHNTLFTDAYKDAGQYWNIKFSIEDINNEVSSSRNLQTKQFFNKLQDDAFLQPYKNSKNFCKKLAYYFSELIATQRFIFGTNGRTNREFISQLATFNGYKLDFTSITKQNYTEIIESSYSGNNKPLEKMFNSISSKL